MVCQKIFTALAVCTLAFNAVTALKRPHLQSLNERKQARAEDAVREATYKKIEARQGNSTSRFLNNATQSQPAPFDFLFRLANDL